MWTWRKKGENSEDQLELVEDERLGLLKSKNSIQTKNKKRKNRLKHSVKSIQPSQNSSSDEEEFSRVKYISGGGVGVGKNMSKSNKWSKQRVVESVDNPNYSISMNLEDEDSEAGSSSANIPTQRNVMTSEDARRRLNYRREERSNGGGGALLGRIFSTITIITCFCCNWCSKAFKGNKELKPRELFLHKPNTAKFTPNTIKNQKYNIITFLPYALFNQFKFFLNLYFLTMAMSQFIPDIRIGYWYTYWGPLIFVLMVTLMREAADDLRRRERDKEINNQKYLKLNKDSTRPSYIPSKMIKVGDLLLIEKDQRIPADMVLLRTSDKEGRCFIRTDQLDGETDWKLRLPILQDVESDNALFRLHNSIYAEKPQQDIHSFVGTLTKFNEDYSEVLEENGISLENTLWANTVIAAGNAIGIVIYTGGETRTVMNNSIPRSKFGIIDMEVNDLTKILFVAVAGLAFLMIMLKGWEGPWYRYLIRFILLFSYIIPISLRVNLDMAKAFYSWTIQRDQRIPGTNVRSTTIPEELGRIGYLLSDKTGTLTQNEMIFKRLCHETSQTDSAEEIKERLKQGLRSQFIPTESHQKANEVTRVTDAIKALATCHNVTPVYDENNHDPESEFGIERECTYQASSPDEIALVKFTKESGLSLVNRDQSEMTLRSFDPQMSFEYQILQIFPFTSEAKRMGIVVKDKKTGEILFFLKGADGVMKDKVKYNDWLEEACDNMAREGLRTLVFGKKILEQKEYDHFERRYNGAKSSKTDRANLMKQVMESLEVNLDLICVTGVEDTLQKDVKATLETLRNAGIKVWMLTGDKLETAVCIAKSSKLVSNNQEIYIFKDITDRAEAFSELNSFQRKNDSAMIIKGESLDICLRYYEKEFMNLACVSPAVVVCRCSPTQKALVVQLVKKHTSKVAVAAVGDGGNDVAMIQEANVGIGLEGKEGRQASLAADFSITQFSYIASLLLIHGRYSYKRSATLAQFVMHRGLIITVMQAVFSSIFYFSSVALYQGFLMIGYATVYTMFPVFALVLDKDVKEEDLLRLPELYADLSKGRSLTYKTFFLWVLISVYQGGVIMYGALILFKDEFIHIVSISFTSLILTELIMVALTIRNMHRLMILAEMVSFVFYCLSLLIFHEFFDSNFILSLGFLWKVAVITLLSCFPIYAAKFFVHRYVAIPNYSKIS